MLSRLAMGLGAAIVLGAGVAQAGPTFDASAVRAADQALIGEAERAEDALHEWMQARVGEMEGVDEATAAGIRAEIAARRAKHEEMLRGLRNRLAPDARSLLNHVIGERRRAAMGERAVVRVGAEMGKARKQAVLGAFGALPEEVEEEAGEDEVESPEVPARRVGTHVQITSVGEAPREARRGTFDPGDVDDRRRSAVRASISHGAREVRQTVTAPVVRKRGNAASARHDAKRDFRRRVNATRNATQSIRRAVTGSGVNQLLRNRFRDVNPVRRNFAARAGASAGPRKMISTTSIKRRTSGVFRGARHTPLTKRAVSRNRFKRMN
ncbi:MAG: hypothetical protein VYC34_04270 [Planctomycetota bacterium]|nr:hypothetical protein [Planctomycetota bacterium]